MKHKGCRPVFRHKVMLTGNKGTVVTRNRPGFRVPISLQEFRREMVNKVVLDIQLQSQPEF